MDKFDILRVGIEKYNIEVNSEIIEKFNIYMSMLIEWNKKINLTAITDEEDIVIKHFLDSISCVESNIEFKGKKVIDVGTGAGFPGIPLKIVFPEINLTLLDSLNKRIIFLNEVSNKLGIECEIIHGRAEDYAKKNEYREKYYLAISRAVASMNILAEYTLPFVNIGGYGLYMKGPDITKEIEEAKKAINLFGGSVKEILSTNVYNSDFNHYIVKVKKERKCPDMYPRKAGMVGKNPIK